MGVYIEGMEMPKSCYYCSLTNDGFYLCMATQPFKTLEDECEERRPNWCPLTEVPEPHGRLIDADVLADDLEADGKEFGEEMKLNCASWLRSNSTPTVIERTKP